MNGINRLPRGEPATIVELVGDVDELGMKRVTATLNSALKRGTSAVIVSFERTTFFESILLRELMRIGEALTIVRRRLLIVMPRGHPGRRVFHLLNLDRRFECFVSQAQALESAPHVGLSRGSELLRLRSWAQCNAS